MRKMPVILPIVQDLENDLSAYDHDLVCRIVGRGGRLRSSKPTDGESAYIWRMVTFFISSNPQHHCIPVTADFRLPDTYWRGPEGNASYYAAKRKARTNELDTIVDKIINKVPKDQWHGVKCWSNALYGISF